MGYTFLCQNFLIEELPFWRMILIQVGRYAGFSMWECMHENKVYSDSFSSFSRKSISGKHHLMKVITKKITIIETTMNTGIQFKIPGMKIQAMMNAIMKAMKNTKAMMM